MAAIERKFLAHYIDSNMGAENIGTNYVRLGKDLEEYSEELNPQVEIKRTLGGEPYVVLNGYQAQSSVEPYYADESDLLFPQLCHIANQRITDDSCKTTKVDVLYNSSGTQLWAYREDCYIIPNSVGGNTSGVQIPFNVYPAGNRVYGAFNATTKQFTEENVPSPVLSCVEYEMGAVDVTSDIVKLTISYSRQHSEAPVLVALIDVTGTFDGTTASNVAWLFLDHFKIWNKSFYLTSSSKRYSTVFWLYRSSATALGVGHLMCSYSSNSTGSSSSSYTRYWVSNTKFNASSNSTSRYWRSGHTYKWIAVWNN